MTHGPVPAPTIMWPVRGGQWTKSHRRSGRSSPSITSSASPETTRKSSWSASQWYMPIDSPGSSANMWTPTCGKSTSPSKWVRAPRPSAWYQRPSVALSTNQPSPVR